MQGEANERGGTKGEGAEREEAASNKFEFCTRPAQGLL